MNSYYSIIIRRRQFLLDGYNTLADVGMDGEYVSPLQISSRSPVGPALVAYNWFDAPSVLENVETLRAYGYMPGIQFNKVLEAALNLAGLKRGDVYMTQAFHLLPSRRSERIPFKHIELSFDAITRHELQGRKVVALGADAARACQRFNIPHTGVPHPSARTGSHAFKAGLISEALR